MEKLDSTRVQYGALFTCVVGLGVGALLRSRVAMGLASGGALLGLASYCVISQRDRQWAAFLDCLAINSDRQAKMQGQRRETIASWDRAIKRMNEKVNPGLAIAPPVHVGADAKSQMNVWQNGNKDVKGTWEIGMLHDADGCLIAQKIFPPLIQGPIDLTESTLDVPGSVICLNDKPQVHKLSEVVYKEQLLYLQWFDAEDEQAFKISTAAERAGINRELYDRLVFNRKQTETELKAIVEAIDDASARTIELNWAGSVIPAEIKSIKNLWVVVLSTQLTEQGAVLVKFLREGIDSICRVKNGEDGFWIQPDDWTWKMPNLDWSHGDT